MSEYRSALEKVFCDFQLSSMVVGIYNQGKIEYQCFGIYDDRIGKPADENTHYMIGSTSKSFIATAVMKLVEEKKLDLDEKVITYLPDFRFYNDKMTNEITIRMILSHQTGLPRHDVSWVNNTEISLEEMVNHIQYLQPAFEIGERFYYQNHMFALASYLVEKVSGMPWQQYVKQQILDQIGMEDTILYAHDFGKGEGAFARPYAQRNGMNIPWQIWPSDNMGSAASITSTVKDALSWMITNLNKGVYEGKQIFSSSSDQQLHSCQMPIYEYEMYGYPMSEIGVTSSAYGLGWFVEEANGEKIISHGGTVGGFKSACGFLPEHNFAYAIFANVDSTQAVNAAAYTLCDIVCKREIRDWSSIFKNAAKMAGDRSKQMLEPVLKGVNGILCDEACDGIYTHKAYGKVKIFTENGVTKAIFLGQALQILTTASGLCIVDAMDLAQIAAPCKFIKNKDKVCAFAIMLEPALKDFIVYEK